MSEVLPDQQHQLSRDLPCFECGHAMHTYLPCSDACGCAGAPMPGAVTTRAAARTMIGALAA